MLRDALSGPTRTDDAATTMFMGGLIVLVATATPLALAFVVASTPLVFVLAPLAVFPPLVLRGYYVRTVQVGLRGDDATPSFVHWSDLVRDGAKSVLLSLGYLLPLGALLALTGALTFVLATDAVTTESALGVASTLGVVLAGFGTAAYGVVYLYVHPAALASFAAEGRLRDAFAFRRVLRLARSTDYATGWLLATMALGSGLAVAAPTTLALVGVVVAFYARVVEHYLYGRGAASTLGVSDERPDAESTSDGAAGTDFVARPPEAAPSVQTGRTVEASAAPRADDDPQTPMEDAPGFERRATTNGEEPVVDSEKAAEAASDGTSP